MSTKGKTWKWKEGAKRNWKWAEQSKKAQTKYKCDDIRIINCFRWMHSRCIRTSRTVEFPRTESGFNAFVKELGPIPGNIKRPSVGRKDHNKGYVYGNIVWEEYAYNVWKKRRTEQDVQNKINEAENEIPF